METFLDFRFSPLWYVFLAFVLSALLYGLFKKDKEEYKKISTRICWVGAIFFLLISLSVVAMNLFVGDTNDSFDNYMSFLLIVGPIIIAGLILYALKKEKKSSEDT